MAKEIWLSVVIPSYKDPYLHNTIDSLLKNSRIGDRLEVLPVLDGYWPKENIVEDPRVRVIHKGKNEGMREAINTGVRASRGRYIMRTDEHCMYAPGYDLTMITQINYNWIVTPIRYFLDPKKWEIIEDMKPVVYEKLKTRKIDDNLEKFEGQVWRSREKKRKKYDVDETMAMQGSCWLMKRRWWDHTIGRLETEHYGTMYQDSHEMQFKTWEKGGKLMVNKNTWFAHKHVSFPRTHHYGRKEWEPGVRYAIKEWKDYYEKEIRPKWNV